MLTSGTRRLAATTIILLVGAILGARGSFGGGPGAQAPATPDLAVLRSRLSLASQVHPQTGLTISQGTFAVPEDRASGRGRLIRLSVVVLRARSATPKPDPVFVFAGGPGADVTQSQRGYLNSWQQQDRDVVLVSQRGTGGDNRLGCSRAVDDDNVQGYLDPLFRDDVFKPCLEDLKAKFDLTKYLDRRGRRRLQRRSPGARLRPHKRHRRVVRDADGAGLHATAPGDRPDGHPERCGADRLQEPPLPRRQLRPGRPGPHRRVRGRRRLPGRRPQPGSRVSARFSRASTRGRRRRR